MKKIVLVVGLLILAGALAAPKLIGDKAHQAYLESIEQYPVGTSGISFEQKSYEQSWFTSRAVTVMKIPFGGPELKNVSVVLTSHIAHGPIVSTDKGIAFGLAYVKSEIALADLPAKAQELADQYLPPGTITTASLIDFKQVSHNVMHMASIDFKNDKAGGVFGGMNVTGVSKLDYSLLQGRIDLPSSHLASENLSVDIADASGSYDQHKYHEMLLGKTELNFPQIRFVAKQGAVTLEDFRMASDSEEQSGKLNVAASFGVRKITAPVPVTAFQYDVQVNQIDDKAFALWSEIAQEMRPRPADPAAALAQPRPTDPATALNNPKLRQLAELLLQKGLEMKQQFTLDGTSGSLHVDWYARSVGLPEGVHIDDKTDRAQLLKAVDSILSVSIDEKALMATPFAGMVAPYLQRGMVVKQGDKLVTEIKLADGVLTVNGNPVPIGKAGK